MPTYNVTFYDIDPLGMFSNTAGGTGTFTGPTNPDASGTITDNQTGIDGASLDDQAGETATMDAVIGGTSTTGSTIYAEESWTVLDTVSGLTFQVVTLRIDDGANTGYYTLSEKPLINGRIYETVNFSDAPDAGTDAVFTYDDFDPYDPGIVEGGTGDDVIDADYLGDPDTDRVDDPVSGTAQEFNWTDYTDEQNLEAGATQNTGDIDVSFTYSDVNAPDVLSAETSETIYVAGGEPFNTTSAGYMFSAGAAEDTTLTFDFAAATGSTFNDEVQNVQFRISDIDGLSDGTNDFQDIVTIQAFDADGNPVDVNITGGANHTVDDATGTITASLANLTPADAAASALIEIEGPVAQIVITYDNGGTTQQAIYFSDIHFETVSDSDYDDVIEAGAGNDTITGGLGADTVLAGIGDDTINVGVGDDASGEDGDDTFVIDTDQIGGGTILVDGGAEGGTDTDTLDFAGQLQYGTLVTNADPDDTGAFSGSATLLDGTVVTFDNIENVLCFTDGMLLETPHGPRLIEDLQAGDLVLTRDNGPQVVRWHGARRLMASPEVAPIEISAGVFGNEHAIRVSPQHRILCEGFQAQLYFGQEEVLVAAKHLVNGTSIRQLEAGPVAYHHLLFDQHEIVTCDGVDSESYHPGSYSLPGLDPKASEELFSLFPSLRSDPSSFGPAARFSVKGSLGHILAA